MGRPAQGYYVDADRVPSVTTVTGARKFGVDGLLHWAYRLGTEGKDFNESRKAAASAGSLSHNLIEQFLQGKEPWIPEPDQDVEGKTYTVDMIKKARQGFESFLEWWDQTKIDVTGTEVSLVSRRHRYGGTLDAVGTHRGMLSLLDWKVSNRVYHDYLYQLAAYKHLWEENHDGDKIERIHLIRFGKNYADFHHHSFPMEVIDKAWEGFLALRHIYDVDKQLVRAV